MFIFSSSACAEILICLWIPLTLRCSSSSFLCLRGCSEVLQAFLRMGFSGAGSQQPDQLPPPPSALEVSPHFPSADWAAVRQGRYVGFKCAFHFRFWKIPWEQLQLWPCSVARAEPESLWCSFPSELPVMQSEALPEQGLRFSMFSSKHLMESDLSGQKGGGESKIKTPLNTSILF